MKVNEIFGPTIQGEGKSVGREVMFIRLSLCNLHCIWCDTPYTWNWHGTKFSHPQKFDKSIEVHEMSNEEILKHLFLKSRTVKSIVLSGGEPLVQQHKLISLLQLLKGNSYWIEVETNGTIAPTQEFLTLIDQVNCSPKLSNSQNSVHEREKPFALKTLSQSDKVCFKFVVMKYDDIFEINELVSKYSLRNVYLMPEGRAIKELDAHQQQVKQMCDEFKYTFTDRLHIRLFGTKRAV